MSDVIFLTNIYIIFFSENPPNKTSPAKLLTLVLSNPLPTCDGNPTSREFMTEPVIMESPRVQRPLRESSLVEC